MNRQAITDDKELLKRLQDGDEQAFASVFFHYFKPLSLFAARFTHDLDDAKDVVSTVMLNLWEGRKLFSDLRHLKSYLYNAVRNGCLNRQASIKHAGERQLEFAQSQGVDEPGYLLEITRAEAMIQLYRAIDTLPQQAGKIISMTYLDEKSDRETADELNLSINTVKFQKRRGVALLRKILSPDRFLLLVAATIWSISRFL